METNVVELRIEEFVRTRFGVSKADPWFDRKVDLFEQGYIDSVGVVELLEFLQAEFKVDIPDDDVMADDFSNIVGLAQIVLRNWSLQTKSSEVA